VNAEGQFFKCFGCGKGGDVFTFIMETERVDFPQALAMLAERAHVPMPDATNSRTPEQARLYDEGRSLLYRLNEFAARFFRECLAGEGGAAGRAYLAKRGISAELAEAYRIGFAPDSWDALCNELRGRKALERHIVAAGLAVERKDGTGIYDRFRNRLIFPIADASGRCVGFGARALSDTDNPKYLNSPETPIFSKGRLLFGLAEARAGAGADRRVMLMEGYTDVIMAAQKGFPAAVATLGTSLTRDHLRLLRRFADSVLLLFDSDGAGLAAAERGLDLFFEEELPARVVTLEPGLDPCDYLLERGPEAFRARLDASIDLFDFKLAAVRSGHDMNTAHGRRAAVGELMETVCRVADPVMAAELRRRAAEAFGLPEEVLAAQMAALRRPETRRQAVAEEAPPGQELTRLRKAERELAGALLVCPSLLADAARALDGFSRVSDPAAAEVLRAAEKIYRDLGELNVEEMATSLTMPEAVSLVAELQFSPSAMRTESVTRVSRVLADIERIIMEDEIARLGDEIGRAEPLAQAEIAVRMAQLKRQIQAAARRRPEPATEKAMEE
jgi:DNA primase